MHAGNNGQLYAILFHPSSDFALRVRDDLAPGQFLDLGSQIIDQNAATTNQSVDLPDIDLGDALGLVDGWQGSNRAHQPQCGRSPYCSRASDCSSHEKASGCKCIAAKFRRDYWSSTCQIPVASAITDAGRGLLGTGNTTMRAAPRPGDMLPSYEDLTCPCNCTYVSHACCTSDSGIVHEPRRHNLGALIPPSRNLTCDLGTGDWVVKHSS